MTAKTIILAAVLAALPALSYASCSARGHQAQSCAPGTVWDSNAQTCVKQINS
ncbi:carbohydrate-binding module family 14 protein [Seohaeicola saemankumensis]|nr:carbohydrate-binding module family 14 protein [Seohaeicola saemankumensis]MCA0872377.1 carbohydrate-binding module family 14 protein [Seohaeicola saemankumensis]